MLWYSLSSYPLHTTFCHFCYKGNAFKLKNESLLYGNFWGTAMFKGIRLASAYVRETQPSHIYGLLSLSML